MPVKFIKLFSMLCLYKELIKYKKSQFSFQKLLTPDVLNLQ